jgi:hypothetical protein
MNSAISGSKPFVPMQGMRVPPLKMQIKQINKTDQNDAEGLAQIVRTGWDRPFTSPVQVAVATMYYLRRAIRVPPPGPQGQPRDPTWRFEVMASPRYSRCQGPRKRRADQQAWPLNESCHAVCHLDRSLRHDPVLTLRFEKFDPYAPIPARSAGGHSRRRWNVLRRCECHPLSGPHEIFFMKVRKCFSLDCA